MASNAPDAASVAHFYIKPEITVGDILTLVTILITLYTLYSAWVQSKRIREKELATNIRNACANVLGKLERWRELNLSIFENAQPLYVETSEMLEKNQNVIKTRDYLWKSLNAARNEIRHTVLEEKLESAYTDLYGYSPQLVDGFTHALEQLKTVENAVFTAFLAKTQDSVMDWQSKLNQYTSAMLGNELRELAAQHGEQFEKNTHTAIAPLKQKLTELLRESDQALINPKNHWVIS